MMHMTFYWGTKVTLLFDSWKTDSWFSYLLTLFACFLFSAFYQYMEDRRIRFNAIAVSNPAQQQQQPVNAPLLTPKRRISSAKFATALLFGINSAIGYLLMLAIMSFNGGVFLAIVVGLAVGFLLFRSGDEEQEDLALTLQVPFLFTRMHKIAMEFITATGGSFHFPFEDGMQVHRSIPLGEMDYCDLVLAGAGLVVRLGVLKGMAMELQHKPLTYGCGATLEKVENASLSRASIYRCIGDQY
ncbi:unnamed protein product [Dovyalis caffra]|uniref:Copper transport protein n=1 Tax=Dovyalis caffra TaxID=77055 RepID=A0AAV1SNB6_9ROSI|nr:unnamed protein product [Dovyalis caffra]